jgi:exosortase E/protease (VPEID-CTERM system)
MSIRLLVQGLSLRNRLFLSAALLIAELLVVTLMVDTESLLNAPGLTGMARDYGASGLRFLVLALMFSLAFAAIGARNLLTDPGRVFARHRCGAAFSIHLAAFCTFTACCILLCSAPRQGKEADALVVVSIAGALATIVTCAVVLVTGSFWARLAKSAPLALAAGLASAGAASLAIQQFRATWRPLTDLTFAACYRVLRLLPFPLVYQPASYTIGTQRFNVEVWYTCSGFEGVLMILVFTAAWLGFFRRDFRFPQALLMLPAGMVAAWLLNVVRIVTLILIGNAGAPGIAVNGFHSQAGWIAFILLAVTLPQIFQRWRWTTARAKEPMAAVRTAATDTTAYLAPFLAILAAGMTAQAASAGFEWLYPLRVLAAGAALWRFRPVLAKLNWKAGAEGVVAGIAVFILWIGWDRLSGGARTAMPAALVQEPAALRWGWVAFRTLGSVVTVPVAEEIAFRGYLLRRLTGPDFAAIGFRQTTTVAILGSSVVFGLLHGRFWPAGIAAGIVYALAARRSGRIGDAAMAHSVTNLLLSISVLVTGDWHLW